MGCSIPSSQIEAQLIRPRCATQGCHDRGDRAGGLDLQSPGVAARLVDQRSNCMGQPLVDSANRAMSYFIRKVENSPMCGQRMPLGQPAFSASEVACVRTWVGMLDPNMSMPDAGMDVPNPPNDVPTPMDVPQPDTGVPGDVVTMDVPSPMDTGVPVTDTGVPVTDTGVVTDTGIPRDTGVSMDSGVPTDSGVSGDM